MVNLLPALDRAIRDRPEPRALAVLRCDGGVV
jgi:hypothetical protein